MKIILFVYSFFSVFVILSQNGSTKLNLESFSLQYGQEHLYHGRQHYSNFLNTLQGGTYQIENDSNFRGHSPNNYYTGFNCATQFSFRKEESKWQYSCGLNWISRTDRYYEFWKYENHIVDTAYVPKTAVYFDSDSDERNYFIYFDSLLVDSLIREEQLISYHSQNLLTSGEILYDLFRKNKYLFSIGFGLSMGLSITNKVTIENTKAFKLLMVEEEVTGDYAEYWQYNVPTASTIQGTVPYDFAPLDRNAERIKRNTQFLFRPYIPIQVEARFANQGFFSKLGFNGSINAGYEFQFVKADVPRARFFWNYQAGLFYRI